MHPIFHFRAHHPRKLARCRDRRGGGGHRARGIRDNKTPRRREESDAILEAFGKSSSIVGNDDNNDDDDVKHDNDSSVRIEIPPTATKTSKKSDREAASGDENSGGAKPRATTGSWFAAKEEWEDEGESKIYGDTGDDDDDDISASDSLSDKIINSRRCHRGESTGMLGGGSPGEGRGADETVGGGSVGSSSELCWGESSKGRQTPARCNSLMLSYERGNNSDLVQCVIVRNVSETGHDIKAFSLVSALIRPVPKGKSDITIHKVVAVGKSASDNFARRVNDTGSMLLRRCSWPVVSR